MSDKSKRQTLSLFDINRCLEEFKTKDHQGKPNAELALVARDLLNLPKVPLRETIRQWKLKEKTIKLQIEKHSEGSKKNRYRRPKNAKRLQPSILMAPLLLDYTLI